MAKRLGITTPSLYAWKAKFGKPDEVGYGSKPHYRDGPIGAVANVLHWDFTLDAPNKVWVTDLTYIRTDEGRRYLAAVLETQIRTGRYGCGAAAGFPYLR